MSREEKKEREKKKKKKKKKKRLVNLQGQLRETRIN